MSKNRPEWLFLDQCSIMFNNTLVPFWDNWKSDIVKHVLEITNLETIFCSGDMLIKLFEIQDTHLKNIVCFE